jgi:hypothetical protein
MGVARVIAGIVAHAVIVGHMRGPDAKDVNRTDRIRARAWVRSLTYFTSRPRLMAAVEEWWAQPKAVLKDCPVAMDGRERKAVELALCFPAPTRKQLAQRRRAARKYGSRMELCEQGEDE